MFGSLDRYLDGNYASAHRHGTLLIGRNGQQRRNLTVFAVLRTRADALAAFDVEHPANARDYLLSHSQVKWDDPGRQILALSTCDGANDSMRLIVACSVD